MPHSIEKIKSTLIGGGARPNLFQVDLTSFPGSGDAGYDSDSFSILCKAAQLPASNVASIDVPFRGRIFKVAGDRTSNIIALKSAASSRFFTTLLTTFCSIKQQR